MIAAINIEWVKQPWLCGWGDEFLSEWYRFSTHWDLYESLVMLRAVCKPAQYVKWICWTISKSHMHSFEITDLILTLTANLTLAKLHSTFWKLCATVTSGRDLLHCCRKSPTLLMSEQPSNSIVCGVRCLHNECEMIHRRARLQQWGASSHRRWCHTLPIVSELVFPSTLSALMSLAMWKNSLSMSFVNHQSILVISLLLFLIYHSATKWAALLTVN